jgi:hypothetical protein
MIAEVVNSGIQPLQNLRVLQQLGDKKTEWAKNAIQRGFIGQWLLGIELCSIKKSLDTERVKIVHS